MVVRTALGLVLAAFVVNACGGADSTNVIGGGPNGATPPPAADPGAPDPSADAGAGADAWTAPPPPPVPTACTTDELRYLPTGTAQWQALCARGNGDLVSKAFCAGSAPPAITSVVELQKLLGLDFKPGVTTNGTNGNPGFAMTSHSTSLVTRHTTVLNPRALVFTAPNGRGRQAAPFKPNANYVAMGFARVEREVELVSKDPVKGDINFFLFRYTLACDASPNGCTPGDLLTPAVESNFASYTLYQDVDIKDTVVDCLQCHQPAGPGTPKLLRMQELQFPWIHFIFNEPQGNLYLRNDFHAAHGNAEAYAGIPANLLDQAAPPVLEAFVENNGFIAQPNELQTKTVMNEVIASSSYQPMTNVPPGVSATWRTQYAKSEAAQVIPVPYHDFKTTDPQKLAYATNAYQAFVKGTLPASQLPDIRDTFLDAAMSDMTFHAAPGLDGKGLLTQMCQQCHNTQLDQTTTRARFNVQTLATAMSPQEKGEAIRRIKLPATDCDHMPPARFRDLSAAEIQLVEQELMK